MVVNPELLKLRLLLDRRMICAGLSQQLLATILSSGDDGTGLGNSSKNTAVSEPQNELYAIGMRNWLCERCVIILLFGLSC